MKRIISLVLCLSMLLSMVPMNVLAAETEETVPAAETVMPEESTASTETEEASVAATTAEATEASVPETTAETAEASVPETTVPEVTAETIPEATQPAQQETAPLEESEDSPEIEISTWIPNVELPSDEELFAGYVDRLFYDNLFADFGTSGREKLDEGNQKIYDVLAEEIRKLASGARSSTAIAVGENMGMVDINLKYYDANGVLQTAPIVCPCTDSNNTDISDVELDFYTLMDVLLADLPYDLYWFDKTIGLSWLKVPSSTGCGSYIFYFSPAADYAKNSPSQNMFDLADYELNTTLTSAASQAAENAQQIVTDLQYSSDYDKLNGYKNKIISLTDYNNNAAAGSYANGYGNPWQLIWVFDNNPSTKVVCEGYSKAFQYLCDRSAFDNDIICYSVVGYLNPTLRSPGAHMWNILTVNDSNYLVDVTNIDSTGRNYFLRGGTLSNGVYYYKLNESTNMLEFTYEDSISGSYSIDGLKFVYDLDTIDLWGMDVLTLATTNLTSSTFPTPPEDPEPTTPTEPEDPGYMTGEELVEALENCTTVNYELTEAVVIDTPVTLPTFPNETPGVITVRGSGSITVADGGSLTTENTLDVADGGTLTVEAGGALTVNGPLCAGVYGSIVIDPLGSCSGENIVLNYPGTITGIDPSEINLYAFAWDEASVTEVLGFQGYARNEVNIAGWDRNQDGTPDPVVLTRDLTIPEGWSFVIGDEMGIAASVRVSEGVTLTNNGTLSICHGASLILEDDAVLASGNGTIGSDGTITSYGTIEGTVDGNGTVSEYMSQAQFQKLLAGSDEVSVTRPLTLTEACTIPAGTTVFVENGGSLTLAFGAKLTLEGTLESLGAPVTVRRGASLTLMNQGRLGIYNTGSLTIEDGAAYQILGQSEIFVAMEAAYSGLEKSEVCSAYTLTDSATDLKAFLEDSAAREYQRFYLTLAADYTVRENLTLPGNMVIEQYGSTVTITDGARLVVNGDWQLGSERIVLATAQMGGNIVVENGELITNGKLTMAHGSTLTVAEGSSCTSNGSIYVDETCAIINDGSIAVTGNDSILVDVTGNPIVSSVTYTQNSLQDALNNTIGKVCLSNPLTLTKNLTVPAGVQLVLSGEGAITVPAERILTNNGRILIANGCGITALGGGAIRNNSQIRNEGTLDLTAGIYQPGEKAELIMVYRDEEDETAFQATVKPESLYPHTTLRVEGWSIALLNTVLNPAFDDDPAKLVKALEIHVTGDLALSAGGNYGATWELPGNATVYIDAPATLTVPSGCTLVNSGAIVIGNGAGLIVEKGGTLKGSQPVLQENGVYENKNATVLSQLTADMTITGPTIVTGTLEIPQGVTLTVSGDSAYLLLEEGAQLVNGGIISVENNATLDASRGEYGNAGGTVTRKFLCDAEGNVTRATILGISANDMKFFAQTYAGDAIIREMVGYVAALVESGELTNHRERDFFPIDFAGETVLSGDLELPGYCIPGVTGTLTVPENVTLTNHCRMVVNGLLIVNGKVISTGDCLLIERSECIVNPENCVNYAIEDLAVESISIVPSNPNPRVGTQVDFQATYYPVGVYHTGEIRYEIVEGTGTLDENNRLTSDVPGAVTVRGTMVDHIDEYGEPVLTDISDEVTVVFFDNQIITIVSRDDFMEDGFFGLYAGSSAELTMEVYGGTDSETPIECDTLELTMEGGDGFASLTEQDGVYTLRISGDLDSHKILKFTASATDDSARSQTIFVSARPKVNTADLMWNNEIVTSKTVQFDMNRERSATLVPVTTPEGACNVSGTDLNGKPLVQWKSSNTSIATVNGEGCVTFLKTGRVTITMTTNFGVKKVTSMTFNVVKLPQSIASMDANPEKLIGGSVANYTVYDTGVYSAADPKKKALGTNAVKWFLCDQDGNPIESHPYATVTTTGRLTTKAVSDEIDVYLMAQVIGNEDIAHLAEPLKVEVYPAVTAVQIQVGDIPISGTLLYDTEKLGTFYPLSYSAGPYEEDVIKSVSWSSSAPRLATIDKDTGLIEVLKPGSVRFTVTATALNNKRYTATVTLKFGVYTRSLSLSALLPGSTEATDDLEGLTIRANDSVTFYGQNNPTHVTTSGVKWSVDNKSYATITPAGVLKARPVVNPVTLWVSAESKDGACTETIPVNILPKQVVLKDGSKMDALVLYDDEYNLITTTTKTLSVGDEVTAFAIDAYDYVAAEKYDDLVPADVSWTSSNTKAVAVKDGVPEAVGTGTAKLTATDSYGRTAYFNVKVSKTSVDVTISQKKTGSRDLSVASGKTLDLVGTVTYDDKTTDTSVTWEVSDTSLATISAAGRLTAAKNLLKPATVTVHAYAKDGSPFGFDSIDVTILPLTTGMEIFGSFGSTYPRDITNTTQKWDLTTQDSTFTLSAKTFPESAMGVTWSSSSKLIAQVDPDTGVVTCLKPGTVTITATAADGSGKRATFRLTVLRTMEADSLTLPETAIVGGGRSLNFPRLEGYYVDPQATSKTLNWSIAYADGRPVPGTVAAISKVGVLTTRNVTAPVKLRVTAEATDGSGEKATCTVTLYPLTSQLTITNAPTGEMFVGSTVALRAVSAPANSAGLVSWSTSNKAVADVDKDTGVVTCLKPGTVVITATAQDGSNRKTTCRLTVIRPMGKDTLTLPKTAIVGGGRSLIFPKLDGYHVDPLATKKTLKWTLTYTDGTSVPTTVAVLTQTGTLTTRAVTAPVELSVTAEATDGSGEKATCTVTLFPLTTQLTISGAPKELPVGNTVTLSAASTPTNSAGLVSWTSSNPAIATVGKDSGNVQCLKPGIVIITAAAQDGSGRKASVTIKVVPSLTITNAPAEIQLNDTLYLNAEYMPVNSKVGITWKSSDEGILYVHKTGGLIQANHTGTATITATASDGTTASVTIRVIPVTFHVSVEGASRFTITTYKQHLIQALLDEELIEGEFGYTDLGGGLTSAFYIDSVCGIPDGNSEGFAWACHRSDTSWEESYTSEELGLLKIQPGATYRFWRSAI